MSWLSRVMNVLRSSRVDRDLDEEIRFHLESRTDELVKAGIAADEASRRARQHFGNTLAVRESSRDIKLLPRFESILRDVGFGLRAWRRNKTVTGAALISLSLAIGACAAGFSLIDALILRPLPIDDPPSVIYAAFRAPTDGRDALSFNYPLFRSLRDAGEPYVRLFAMSDQSRRDATFDDSGEPEKVYGQWVSGDAFRLLGIGPALGRVLAPSDDLNPGQHPVAVLSYDFWMRRFGGRPDVLGRWVTIREKSLQIVGVAEHGFTGVAPGVATDLWAPTMMWDDRAISDPDTRWFQIWGRLEPGVAPEQARTVLQPVFMAFRRQQASLRPEESRERIEQFLASRLYIRAAGNGVSALRDDFARPLWVLAGIALLVLLIACANVASLLVARATTREREMALRVSIGAGRGRLVQQVLVESALLAIAACALGTVIAFATAPQIGSMLSTSRSIVHLDLQMNWRMLAFLSGVGSFVTMVFGMASAIRAPALSPGGALKAGEGRHTARIGLFRPLVVAQVTFSFVVLFVASLCLSGFVKLLRTDLGFDQSHLALASVSTEPMQPGTGGWPRLLERLHQMPGVESVSLSSWGLFEGTGRNKSVRIPGRPVDGYTPWYLSVSPGFFRTMRIPLRAGRDFEWREAQPASRSAVIVNEGFARRYFPGESPLGKRFFRIDGGTTLVAQDIIGVVGDAKYTNIREPAPATVYDSFRPDRSAVVQLRTRLEAAALRTRLREELQRANSALRVADVTWQSTLVDNTLVRDRALAMLSAFFSIIAIVLVIVGLYGVLSYRLIQRTREIGIRLALGAPPRRIVRGLLSEVAVMTSVGMIAGGTAAMFIARFMTAVVFDVEPSAASNAATPLACLLLACAAAAVVPALRATRVDPTIALRSE